MYVQEQEAEIRKVADGGIPISKEKAHKIKIPKFKSFTGARVPRTWETFCRL